MHPWIEYKSIFQIMLIICEHVVILQEDLNLTEFKQPQILQIYYHKVSASKYEFAVASHSYLMNTADC